MAVGILKDLTFNRREFLRGGSEQMTLKETGRAILHSRWAEGIGA